MKRTLSVLILILGTTLAACTTSSSTPSAGVPPGSPLPSSASPSASPSASSGQSQPPLVQVSDPGRVTGTLPSESCQMTGNSPDNYLPDPKCTPGAYDPAITAAVLCAQGYTTKTYRPPASETTAFKYNIAYPAYGLTRGTTTELDHLVSLELGGANDATNLWPEPPGVPNPKDSVENALHRWVCAASGDVAQERLTDAQKAIASNWTTAEQVLGVS